MLCRFKLEAKREVSTRGGDMGTGRERAVVGRTMAEQVHELSVGLGKGGVGWQGPRNNEIMLTTRREASSHQRPGER